METQLLAWQHEWLRIRKIDQGERTEWSRKYSQLSCKFYFHYAMLTINSFGLQNALQRSAVDIGHFFARCHSSAVECATVIADEFGGLGYLKYAPDCLFVQGSYAVLSLLKVCQGQILADFLLELISCSYCAPSSSRSSTTSRKSFASSSASRMLSRASLLLHCTRLPYTACSSAHSFPLVLVPKLTQCRMVAPQRSHQRFRRRLRQQRPTKLRLESLTYHTMMGKCPNRPLHRRLRLIHSLGSSATVRWAP